MRKIDVWTGGCAECGQMFEVTSRDLQSGDEDTREEFLNERFPEVDCPSCPEGSVMFQKAGDVPSPLTPKNTNGWDVAWFAVFWAGIVSLAYVFLRH